jgi:hypothetical protein
MRPIRFSLLAIGSLGVIVGITVSETAWQSSREPPTLSTEATAPPPPARPVPSPEEIARPHLEWAQQQSADVLDEHLNQVAVFFFEAQKNTPQFAKRVLSFGSKWRLAVDYVPLTHGGRHQAFIRRQFNELIFKPSELAEDIEQVISSYLAHVHSIEAEMLVKLRADVADFSDTYALAQFDAASLQAEYDDALAQAVASAGGSLRSDVSSQLVSLIAGEVLTQVAVKLGVSAGILGTGAASSWATFGIGLVVGVIVDQIVSWVWDWYADPVGNLAHQLNRKLDELNRLIVEGSDDAAGLRSRLKTYAEERARLRETAVLALLQTH